MCLFPFRIISIQNDLGQLIFKGIPCVSFRFELFPYKPIWVNYLSKEFQVSLSVSNYFHTKRYGSTNFQRNSMCPFRFELLPYKPIWVNYFSMEFHVSL